MPVMECLDRFFSCKRLPLSKVTISGHVIFLLLKYVVTIWDSHCIIDESSSQISILI